MFFGKRCTLAAIVALGTLSAAQTGTDATSQSTSTGAAPAPSNPPTGPETPAAAPGPTTPATGGAPGANGTAGSAFPALQPAMANPGIRSADAQPASRAAADRDPLLDLPSLPKGKVSLQGGTLVRVDPVLDRLVMIPFKGKREEIAFDVRTQFLRDGQKIAARDLRSGTPIYADTIWDGQHVFAKTVRVFTGTHQDQEHGQIMAFDAGNATLRVRDELFPEPVDLKINSSTVIRKNQSAGSVADLQPGSLVAIKFQPGSHAQAEQIEVLAAPGASFIFSGPVTHIDLLTHVIGISNRSDSVIYDIHFDPARVKITKGLQEGADVDVNATFNGTEYLADGITIRNARASQ